MSTEKKYLKAIYLIQQIEDGPAATGAVADVLDVSPASANEMIGKLEAEELVDHENYKGVTLTDEGITSARTALETYCIIERFLVSVLAVESFRVEARQLESVIDDTVAERLDLIIDRRSECPDCFASQEDKCAFLEAASDG